jgi:hypothetical protein
MASRKDPLAAQAVHFPEWAAAQPLALAKMAARLPALPDLPDLLVLSPADARVEVQASAPVRGRQTPAEAVIPVRLARWPRC